MKLSLLTQLKVNNWYSDYIRGIKKLFFNVNKYISIIVTSYCKLHKSNFKYKKQKEMTHMYGTAITYGLVSLLLLGGFAYLTFKMTKNEWER